MANCEICSLNTDLQKHHIHSTSLGGLNNKHNRALICANCHSDTHRGKVIVEGRFSTGVGDTVVWRKKGEPSITGVNDPPCWIIK